MFLLAGCSFTDNPYFPRYAFGDRVHRTDLSIISARGGAGNYYIAASIIEHLPVIDRVFVLWTGLSRIDLAVPAELKLQVEDFYHQETVGDTVWLMSGGFGGMWSLDDSGLPKHYSAYLKDQYVSCNWEYLSSKSLLQIATCLSLLEKKQIEYTFGFIYDIFANNEDQASLGGAVSRNNPILDLIPWDKCIPSTPYEFCKTRNLLSSDNFHPSEQGYQQWADSVRSHLPLI